MSQGTDELEGRLLDEAAKAIRRILVKKGERDDLSIGDMEDFIGDVEIELRQAMIQVLIEETQQKTHLNLCKGCGKRLRSKGKKVRRVVTLRGEVKIERNYYYYDSCQENVKVFV